MTSQGLTDVKTESTSKLLQNVKLLLYHMFNILLDVSHLQKKRIKTVNCDVNKRIKAN